MKKTQRLLALAAVTGLALLYKPVSSLAAPVVKKTPVQVVVGTKAHVREIFGANKIVAALNNNGYKATLLRRDDFAAMPNTISVSSLGETLAEKIITKLDTVASKLPGKEGFLLQSTGNKSIAVLGRDLSGTLYGCMELAEQINKQHSIPANIKMADKPEMVLRGTCIGVQKPYYLPGHNVYEYPYTPETFPWLYDKKLWVRYLDSMVENRMNSLYLWNGHPFASLVKLKDYPYAVEVDDATFKKNEEIFRFLTEEADKRGIWVIQMFYNIIVSKPFADKHNMVTQDRERPIIPLIADYTRKSIAAFVEKYPNVGLMVALGEAMEGVGNDDIEWFTKTIIPGVKDGLKALGKTEEPPIVLRAHDTDAPLVMKAAMPLYKNLYTEAKFNGEALTTYEPRGAWAELHRTLSRIGTVQIENVHILANLEPFRYGSPDFIRKSVKAMHSIYEANGLHLYPQASYWDWPYTADKTTPRLLQIDRDWIWYKEWARYAWKSNRDSADENRFWGQKLADQYGCSPEQALDITKAYNESGEIAPKLLRRFGITDGNRQTLTLGMLMTQLINPYRYGLFDLLYDSESPEGEKLIEYAEKAFKGQPHIGETPIQIINEVLAHGEKAVAAIEKVAPNVSKNKAEFNRLKNDMYCYNALAKHYAEKAQAALLVLKYKYTNNVSDLDEALPWLQKSVNSYKQLADLTKDTYLYANSMQTKQRKIPIRGVDGTFKTWTEVLVPFEAELSHFKKSIDSLESSKKAVQQTIVLKNANVKISGATERYTVDSNAVVFTDTTAFITSLAKELKGLSGVKLSRAKQLAGGTSISFTSAVPVKVLVGYFTSKDTLYAKTPELETNATANDYGQAEAKIAHSVVLPGWPAVNVHTYSFKAGQNTLVLPRGACLILGFVNDDQVFPLYDAGLYEAGNKREIDWLFE